MGVQVLSHDLLNELDVSSKVDKILKIVKKGDVVLIEGRLSPNEETDLMAKALENVSGKFTGIEIAFLEGKKSTSIMGVVKKHILKVLIGNRLGLTVVGPSKVIKEIKMNPDKLEILFKK